MLSILSGLRITPYDCSDLSYPVLGGVDLVDYFTTFKLSSGIANEFCPRYPWSSSCLGPYGNWGAWTIVNEKLYFFLNVGAKANFIEDTTSYITVGDKRWNYWFPYGGVDLVDYFTTFKLSSENKELFALSPESYLPQYGGFCALGVSNEFCPRYPWSSSCLGPAGNWGAWTVINEKLYFFLDVWAKTNFLEDPTSYITVGDKRWNYWFPDGTIPLLSTKCYETDPTYLD
eukprot:gene18069-23716_t